MKNFILNRETPRFGPASAEAGLWRTIISAMIPEDLLELLVCPACRKPLVLKVNPEALKCNACQRVYPVRDNIPVLLIEESSVDPS